MLFTLIKVSLDKANSVKYSKNANVLKYSLKVFNIKTWHFCLHLVLKHANRHCWKKIFYYSVKIILIFISLVEFNLTYLIHLILFKVISKPNVKLSRVLLNTTCSVCLLVKFICCPSRCKRQLTTK